MLNQNRTFVPKGWGFEDWIWNDDKYCGKKLFFASGRRLSWHYHARKDETFYLQSGRLLVLHSPDDCLEPSTGRLIVRAHPDISMLAAADWLVFSENEGALQVVLEPGDSFHVAPLLRHLMVGVAQSELFEFSTRHYDEDSFRLLKGD